MSSAEPDYELMTVQQCRSIDGWQVVSIASSSDSNVRYTVLVNPWGDTHENVCECRGYQYRGTCKHQGRAANTICGWRAIEAGSELQSKEQKLSKICPRCGGPSQWVMEVVDLNEFES